MQMALKIQLMISSNHHSTNQRVRKPLAFSTLVMSSSSLSTELCRDSSGEWVLVDQLTVAADSALPFLFGENKAGEPGEIVVPVVGT
jgi:hypothetical protein